MADIVIVGAGLTGLSAAYHLEQHGYYNYKLFEKDTTTGGLCRSISDNGFTFDYTGHLLHVSDPYFKQFIETIVGMDNLYAIARRSFIYSHDTYTKYPFQINLFGLKPSVIAECIEEFVKRPQSRKKPRSFYDWVLHNFGAGLAKHFFFPFQQKIFSYNIKKVTPSWTGRFVPQTSLERMIKGALYDHVEDEIGYNAKFYYPKTGGINFWVDKIAQQLKNPIFTSHAVESVDLVNKKVTFTNGTQESFNKLINTMPLDRLLLNLHEPADSKLAQAADKLICNSVINFNIGVNHPNLSDKHWIYYPERQYPFYRLGFAHNFSPALVPANCSSLYGEVSYIKKPRNAVNQSLEQALKLTKKLLNISDADIIMQKIIKIEHAYVIYDAWRDKHVSTLLKRLQDYHVYSAGRYGEWKYSSMQEALLDGKKTAEKLLEKI